MKTLLFFSFLLAWPAAGFSDTIYRNRVYRSDTPPVRRVTTVRTTTAPSIEVYHDWDRSHDYIWNDRRYHWDGGEWVVVYGSRGVGYGSSSTLQDDVGDSTPAEVVVPGTVTRVDVDGTGLAFDVQRRLARRGYYHGPIDGIVGPGTRAAIADFQADNGLEPNGVMTREVVRTLGL